nr:hypothetical protein CFP56_47365 [Quercus suber]
MSFDMYAFYVQNVQLGPKGNEMEYKENLKLPKGCENSCNPRQLQFEADIDKLFLYTREGMLIRQKQRSSMKWLVKPLLLINRSRVAWILLLAGMTNLLTILGC